MKKNELREKIEYLCIRYQDYLAEADVYDGASFWGNDEVFLVFSEIAELLAQPEQEES